MSEIIKVGMADLKTCVSPDGVTTLGLGSCVGIAIRDPVTKIGGLAHIMLPDSTTIRKICRYRNRRTGQADGKARCEESKNGCQDCRRRHHVHIPGT